MMILVCRQLLRGIQRWIGAMAGPGTRIQQLGGEVIGNCGHTPLEVLPGSGGAKILS